jgi:hypothetical protein
MDQSSLYIICGIIALFGLILFARAYHRGNQSMNKIEKNLADRHRDTLDN